jgi:nitrate reductase beta subunit
MVFHLDKCIGCHTCSIACKNIWTDRKGTEYMWFNNVETKPGTGYPTQWEDQSKYRGGWEVSGSRLRLKSTGKARIITNIFHNPHLPTMDDYYEPWTYKYEDLFNAPAGTDQPTALPISKVTGEYLDIKAGPNWDDDLSGSPIYAANDPNLKAVTEEQRQQLQAIERRLRGQLPLGRALQARRGRHRTDQPEALPRVALVRGRLPVQEDLLQLEHGQEREVPAVLPAP